MNDNISWVPGIKLEDMEKACILQAIRFYRGNKTQTSIALGIAIRTLDHKLEKYEAEGIAERARYDRDKQDRIATLNRMRGIVQSEPTEQSNAPQTLREASVGVRLEPFAEPTTQQQMPVLERQEVQAVLPKQAAAGHKRR